MIVGVILEVAEAVIAMAQIGGDFNGYPNFFAREAAVQGRVGTFWADMFPNAASVTTRMVSMCLNVSIFSVKNASNSYGYAKTGKV